MQNPERGSCFDGEPFLWYLEDFLDQEITVLEVRDGLPFYLPDYDYVPFCNFDVQPNFEQCETHCEVRHRVESREESTLPLLSYVPKNAKEFLLPVPEFKLFLKTRVHPSSWENWITMRRRHVMRTAQYNRRHRLGISKLRKK